MATISEHIEQLKIDKQTLVDNLVEKGVTATSDETFTTLVPKVKNIQAGADLSEYFENSISGGSTSQAGYAKAIIKLPALNFSGNIASYMFYQSLLKEIDVSNFDTSKTTNMQFMFYNCSSLASLDLSNFDTSEVTNMNAMFAYSYLSDLNISSFDFSKVTNIRSAFESLRQLKNLQFGSNLGAGYLTTASEKNANYVLNLSNSTLLTETSLISVLNGLYDIKTKGCNVQQCILGSTNLAKLTSAEGQQALAQAEAYGWEIS